MNDLYRIIGIGLITCVAVLVVKPARPDISLIIGITGGSGAGKTSAITALEALGAKVVDCDVLYHELLSDNMELTAEINAHFNDVSTDGKIDRKKLGTIVFNNKDALLKLNRITHRFVTAELIKRIDSFNAQNINTIAIDAIALIESGLGDMCDIVIGITAPLETRISRILRRDQITREQALMRISAQKPENFFRENCDIILENIFDTPEAFVEHCKSCLNDLVE